MLRNLKNKIKGEKFLASRNDSVGYFSGQESPPPTPKAAQKPTQEKNRETISTRSEKYTSSKSNQTRKEKTELNHSSISKTDEPDDTRSDNYSNFFANRSCIIYCISK